MIAIPLRVLTRQSGFLVRLYEEVGNANAQGSGQFYHRGQRRAALPPEDLGQVPFRKICLKIEAVQRAVFLDDQLAEPAPEKSFLVRHTARVAERPRLAFAIANAA